MKRNLSAKKNNQLKSNTNRVEIPEKIEPIQKVDSQKQSLINKDYLRQLNQQHVEQVEKEPKKSMLMSFECAEYKDEAKNDQNYQKFKDNYLQKIQIHDYEVSEAQRNEDKKTINKVKRNLNKSEDKKQDYKQETKKTQVQNSYQYLNEIKENSLNNLKNVLNNKIKVKWLEKTKKELNEFQIEAKDLIEKESQLAKQNQHEVKSLQLKILKQKEEIIQLEKKQKQYQSKFYEYKTKYDELYCDNQSLLQHKKTMDIFKMNYPDMTLEKLIGIFIKEKRDLKQQKIKLEEKIYYFEKEKQSIEEKFKNHEQNLQEMIQQKNKQIQQLNQTLTYVSEQNNNNSNQDFKKLYLQLNNRVLDLYNNWKSKITIFNKRNQENYPQVDLSSPIQIVDLLEQCIKFNTSDKLQDYLRKVIISANQLRRMCLPDSVNERFEPDKLYEQIIKYVKNLTLKSQSMNKTQRKTYVKNGENKDKKQRDSDQDDLDIQI